MAEFRYAQFCPLARASEVVAERWTLLIVRDLMTGPQRFSDLRRRLLGVSTSVLTDRLGRLEERGLISQRRLPPPAASTVYELTPTGVALRPALLELIRWGMRFQEPIEDGDRLAAAWLELGLEAFTTRRSLPGAEIDLIIPDPEGEVRLRVSSGPCGAQIRALRSRRPRRAEATLRCDAHTLLEIVSGASRPREVERAGRACIEGRRELIARLADCFDLAGDGSAPLARPLVEEAPCPPSTE